MNELALNPFFSRQRAWRIFVFYSLAALLTAAVSILFADLLWRTGWSASRTVVLFCFSTLFFFTTLGFWHAVFGFVLRRLQTPLALPDKLEIDSGVSIALAFPVFNEEIGRVCEGLRATYDSLRKTGCIKNFDFFILSDSNVPEKWIEEERQWHDLSQSIGPTAGIYYRRRINNEGKKSGNILDFLSSWGRRYRYFVIFDADSIMSGSTLVELVRLMEAHPQAGMIQTAPALVNAESLFGRMQQFANRFYSPIFLAGLDFWTKGFSNYWGHNAIIRTEAFMRWCALPQLPGAPPFGGHILSHDFVEAALLARENSQVWLAYQLSGSYEEAPQTMIDNAKRDRRWCQGNMQHGMLLFARGLRGISRLHLLLGIFGYLSSPIWLIFLVAYFWMWDSGKRTGLSHIAVHSWMSDFNFTASQHAFIIFLISMAVLLIPRFLAVADALFDRSRRKAYGGVVPLSFSVLGETIFSTLHAPLQMLWHTRFVVSILVGQGNNWATQDRGCEGTSWKNATLNQWWQTACGLICGWLVWKLSPNAFWWFSPLFFGMTLAIPLSVFTSRSSLGSLARQLQLFLTPEETTPPPELVDMREHLKAHSNQTPAGLEASVVDPYINAIHVSLLREMKMNPDAAQALAKLGVGQTRSLAENVLANGFESLDPNDQKRVLNDPDTMSWLHRQIWLRPESTVAPAWRAAMRSHVV